MPFTLDNVFDKTVISKLKEHASNTSDALQNAKQPTWLNFSSSLTSKEAMLKDLDRVSLNKLLSEKANTGTHGELAATLSQLNTVVGITRDYIDKRRSRLYRLFSRIADSEVTQKPSGVLDTMVSQIQKFVPKE